MPFKLQLQFTAQLETQIWLESYSLMLASSVIVQSSLDNLRHHSF